MRLPVSADRYPEAPELMGFLGNVQEEILGLPGVEAVGGVNALPLTQGTSQNAVGFPDSPINTGDENADVLLTDWFTSTPGYFDAMGVPLLAGRDFRPGDDAEALPVAIIDDSLAEHFFPGEDAVGRTMMFFGTERQVVGIVDQPRLYNIHEDDRGQVFVPLAQRVRHGISLAIRSDRDPMALAPEVRRIVGSVDADQPLADIRTMDAITADSLNGERLSLGLIAGLH